MASCERYRAELLDYLYDLLEDDDSRILREHLESCAACQAALLQAQGQQKLLATAARMSFPGVRFEAPQMEAPAEPVTLQLPARPPHRNWGRWTVAAGVLLALGGVAGVWYWQGHTTEAGNNGPLVKDDTPPKDDDGPGVWNPANVNNLEPTKSPLQGWGQDSHGLIARVWADKEEYRVGERIMTHYEIKDTSDRDQALWHFGFWPNHKIVVLDEAGKEVPLTRNGRSRRAAFNPGGPRLQTEPSLLHPGDVTTFPDYELGSLFVFDKPGRYTVQYVYEEKQGSGWEGHLESNRLAIRLAK